MPLGPYTLVMFDGLVTNEIDGVSVARLALASRSLASSPANGRSFGVLNVNVRVSTLATPGAATLNVVATVNVVPLGNALKLTPTGAVKPVSRKIFTWNVVGMPP